VLVLVIDLQSWPARPWGLTLSGEAQREAPAQTELRPTFAFARASHHNRARACPRYRSSIVASSIMGLTLSGEAQREAPAQTELRPPMVCVKLPKSVLGLFHLFRATKLPLFRIEVQADESL
jgi:hypothetical protein